jgi:hypothetical protein
MFVVVMLCLSIAGAAPADQRTRKPGFSPVVVDYNDPPEDMKTGDETTTTITFLATEDVDRLQVSLTPDDGLEIVTPPTVTVFTNIKEGETREIQVKVKLTDAKGASLNVSYATIADSQDGGGAKVIRYGDPTN